LDPLDFDCDLLRFVYNAQAANSLLNCKLRFKTPYM
jgi:hypothetical protein